MRLEFQFSFCFFTDYLAEKVIGMISDKLPVPTTLSLGSFVKYAPYASPSVTNQAPGVVRVLVVLNPLLALTFDLAASTVGGLQVIATLVNRDEIVTLLTQLDPKFDPNLVPSSVTAPLDFTSIVGTGLPAPTQAGFAARTDAQVIAIRVELGAAASEDAASWTEFFQNHGFTPAFQPGDISVDPPREWAALLDWQLAKSKFAIQIEPLVKSKIQTMASDASVTGDFAYFWGLKNDDQPSGLSDGWPFNPSGGANLDVTCPIHAKGHDGHLYLQIGFSCAGRDRMHLHAQIKAHVWCHWQDVAPVDIDHTFGGFGFDGSSLQVDSIATDARGLVVRGEAVLFMPLAFPVPAVDVGNFTWMLEDACNTGTLAQAVSVYLTDASSDGRAMTQLRGRLKVEAPFKYKVDSIPSVDSNGIGIAPLVWTVTIEAQDVPPGGGNVTIQVETNAGTPSFPSGSTVSVPLSPPLTAEEQRDMRFKAVAVCASAKHQGYVKKFVPDPPEEIIWWLTQEVVLLPAASRTETPIAVAGASTRVAVQKSGLVSAMRKHKKYPNGIVQRQSVARDGVRIALIRLQLPSAARAG